MAVAVSNSLSELDAMLHDLRAHKYSVQGPRTPNPMDDYREVQLDSTPEIEVFHMLFERCHTKHRKRSIKYHIQRGVNLFELS